MNMEKEQDQNDLQMMRTILELSWVSRISKEMKKQEIEQVDCEKDVGERKELT